MRLTTISVHPQRADELREIRDERELKSMDAALEALLEEQGE